MSGYYNIDFEPSDGTRREGRNDQQRRKVLLAVLGVTGSGKSSFINVLSGKERVQEITLAPTTSETAIHRTDLSYEDGYGDVELLLLDTPGFDSPTTPDILVLDELVKLVRKTSADGVSLSGILYLHRITDVRIGGSITKNLQLLRELCGKTFIPRLTLVTTMWDIVRESVGARRERDLQESFWNDLIDSGAKHERYDGTRSGKHGALKVIERYLLDPSPPVETASIQQQAGWPLRRIDAGRFQLNNLNQKIMEFTSKLKEMRNEHASISSEARLYEDRALIEEEISQREQELKDLKDLLARYSHDDDSPRLSDVEAPKLTLGEALGLPDVEVDDSNPRLPGPQSPSLTPPFHLESGPRKLHRKTKHKPAISLDDSEASSLPHVYSDVATLGRETRRPRSSMAKPSHDEVYHSPLESRRPRSSPFEPVDESTYDSGASLAENMENLSWNYAEGPDTM